MHARKELFAIVSFYELGGFLLNSFKRYRPFHLIIKGLWISELIPRLNIKVK